MNRSTLANKVQRDVSSLRENYTKGGLLEEELPDHPIILFKEWFDEAVQSGTHEPNAMALATTDIDGHANVRYVLMKGIREESIQFYTNYESEKGKELSVNPYASVVFWWPELERQVRIRGSVKKMSERESTAYFKSRPRSSQIGAWASDQSRLAHGREELEERFKNEEEKYGVEEIPKPPFWGGYEIHIEQVEFWQGRPGRLHDRVRFTRHESKWKKKRLQP